VQTGIQFLWFWIPAGVYPVLRYGAGMTMLSKAIYGTSHEDSGVRVCLPQARIPAYKNLLLLL